MSIRLHGGPPGRLGGAGGGDRYRTADLGNERALVVRCAVDAVLTMKGQEQMVSVKALNEFDPKCGPPRPALLPAVPGAAAMPSGCSGAHCCILVNSAIYAVLTGENFEILSTRAAFRPPIALQLPPAAFQDFWFSVGKWLLL